MTLQTDSANLASRYLELAEGRFVFDLRAFEQDADDEARVLVGQDRPGRLDEQVGERLERLERQALQLRRHQAPDAAVEVRYAILHRQQTPVM